MIVLHGSWCPMADGTGGRFFLWGEAAASPPSRRGRPPRLSAHRAREHPGQVSTRQVRTAWAALAPSVPMPALESEAVIWLPSRNGRPEPCPELGTVEDKAPLPHESVLAAWRVNGLVLPAEQALTLLASLPRRVDAWPEVRLGPDLRYWSLAAKLALELLCRQQYLPSVLRCEDGSLRAAWAPYLAEGADQERLSRLIRAMPPVCRALTLLGSPARHSRVTPAGLPTASALLLGFIETVVDGTVRQWGGVQRRSERRCDDVALQWQSRLTERLPAAAALPAVEAAPRDLRAFYEHYRAWSRQISATGDGGFRVCFRLEPPEEPGDGEPATPPEAEAWTLRFLLQATDDPSLLVPAEAVWRESSGVLHYLGRRFEEPQERLLAALGRAARVFAPLEKSLQEARPSACTLTTGEAYTFLRECAPLLEAGGFGLLVPPWWGRRTARLGLHLRVTPAPAAEGRSSLGLDALVHYDWQVALGDEPLSREEFERLAALKVPLVRIRGQWVELRTDQVESLVRFLNERGRGEDGSLRQALRLAQMVEEGPPDGLSVGKVTAEGWIDEVLRRLAGRETLTPVAQPASFRGLLRPYQGNGLSWLAFLHRWGLGGCLADDMGLGKTVQVLALLLHAREQGLLQGPWLLICPTSAVGNWQRETQRFAPDLRVVVHHGVERARGEEFEAEAARHDLVLSTYSLLSRDEETLARVQWDGVVLDEAQNIKNPGTLQAQAARRLRARHRLALTGTPVENRLGELWSIMEFLNPGYLGSQADFRRRFVLPIERYQDPDALRQLRSLVRPFLLRRVKSDPLVIRDLPEKVETLVYCRLTQEQATLYQAVVNDAMQQIAEADGIQRRGLVLAMLLKLKQVCNHPAQFLHDGSVLAGRSGKLARLTEMLEEAIADGDRALVFTQFAEMGEMLRRHLQAELNTEALFLHGGTPRPQREQMIRRFQEDPHGPPIFILSLKAGGTALNLMRANHVFHFDRWWNPAVENQATDRAYRIGQNRKVLVHKFICIGTLEERIAELIESKRALAEGVVESGEAWLTELSTEELRELLVLQKDAVEA